MKFLKLGKAVVDPDTGEDLGSLDTIKEIVEAINVYPKMCLCRHTIITNIFTGISGKYVKINAKTLDVEATQISGGLSNNLTIRIGDKVRLIETPENQQELE